MPATATTMEATVVRDAPVVKDMRLELQMPGLGTSQAVSKDGSVRLTADTAMIPVMLLNVLRVKSAWSKGK